MSTQAETFQFQAEITQLLNLMVHSLYTSKELFLRELISNASDALDRLHFEALISPDLMDNDHQMDIRLEADRTAKTLTIHDTGIGMSREEVIANIGTIAKSGTRELRDKIKDGTEAEKLAELIGQFGVGFYSSFMVANRVELITRRAGEQKATRWESTGDGTYTVTETTKPRRGTSITLHLKPFDPENGIEDYTDKWILARCVKRFSDFIIYPIICPDQLEVPAEGEAGNKTEGATTTVIEKTLNSMKPIWTRPPSDVEDREYAEFYKHITHDLNEPAKTIPLKAEGTLEYQALLFIPSRAPSDLFYVSSESGLRLFSKRVLIMEACHDLLPRYLRFVRGVIDCLDLPLNISRQMLQQGRHVTQMRKWLTKKVLDALQSMQESENDKYLMFWEQFGRAIKEAVGSDHANKDKILSLLLFASSAHPEKLTTLKDYVARMTERQEQIFYLTGESRRVVENSPHLEVFRQEGYEVLYLTDPVDELVVQSLREFEGKKLKSVVKGTIELGDEETKKQVEQALKQKEAEASELLEFFQKTLDEHVKVVRLTNRLTTSPACLVGAEHDYSPQLERLLLKGKGAGSKQRRIMELNPKHEMFDKMQEHFKSDHDDPLLRNYAELLLGYALLAEGSELPDPVQFNHLVIDMMTRAL